MLYLNDTRMINRVEMTGSTETDKVFKAVTDVALTAVNAAISIGKVSGACLVIKKFLCAVTCSLGRIR